MAEASGNAAAPRRARPSARRRASTFTPDVEQRLSLALREVFGWRTLRPGQRGVIARVMDGRSTLAIMPTGAGKSLCYQLPAVVLPGQTVVVSPLIALMKDQCEKLAARGVEAVEFNSQRSAEEIHAAESAVEAGRARVIFTTPERLADADFVALLRRHRTSLLVVDEAHCISQWGHDFRPAYLELGEHIRALGQPVVLALTATANDDVAAEIMQRLRIAGDGRIDTGAFRANLRFAVRLATSEGERQQQVVEQVKALVGSGIVYAATVRAAEAVHAALVEAGEPAGLYHGRLRAAQRRDAQDAFMAGRCRVMVATNAFGMGIDKRDIRFVVHCQMPGSLDAYYQEAGRAGRDGAPADCMLFYLQRDRAVQQFFLSGAEPGAAELRRLAGILASQPPAPGGWTLAELQKEAGMPRQKVERLIALLRQHGGVQRNADGRVRVDGASAGPIDADALVAEAREKREQDRAALERMTFFAKTGLCRWQVLLSGLGSDELHQRCGTCDNCVRAARHQQAQAAIELPAAEPERPLSRPGFQPRQNVRVARYGAGQVISADALSVTIEFADGSERCFQPEFVRAVRAARRAALDG